jgi:hypothetical protein
MLSDVGRHFVYHWRVWTLIAVIVIVVNEGVDRNFFDHRQHVDGDLLIAVVAVVISFLVSYMVARLKSTAARGASSRSRLASIRPRGRRIR